MKAYPVVCGRHMFQYHVTPLWSDEEFENIEQAIVYWRDKFRIKLIGIVNDEGVFLWRLFPTLKTGPCTCSSTTSS